MAGDFLAVLCPRAEPEPEVHSRAEAVAGSNREGLRAEELALESVEAENRQMASEDNSLAKCGQDGHAAVSLPSSPSAFFALSRKRPPHVSLPTSPKAPSADRAGNCSPDSLPAQSRDRLRWPSNPSDRGIRAGSNAHLITVTATPTRRTVQPPPSNDRKCPSISTLATPARRQVPCSGARQSLPDLCGVHAPTLYEFSLVEDLATGSSIYKHKYHEKAAAMEVRMSEFARRLVASLAGPLMLSVPVVSDTLAELLEATTHADGDHRSQVCRRVEAGFSILLVVVSVCSYCVSGASPFAHDGYAMAFLYVAMTTLHAAIRSPDKVGQYVTTKHDFQPDAGSQAAPVTQLRPASPSCERQNGDWESSGDSDAVDGRGLDGSTSRRQESDASQSGLSASCGRDRAEQHGEAASEATPTIKTSAAVAMSARRHGIGEDWDSEGAPPRPAQRAVSFEGLHPGSVASGTLSDEGGGEAAGSTGLAARQSKAPVKADSGRGGGAGATEGIEFIELQERWRMMQRKSVLAYTSARQAVYTSLDQLCQEVFAARGMDWKAARKRAATRTAFGAALYALTAPLHRVVEAELTKLATVHVSRPGGWRLSDLFVLGMEGAGSKSGAAVASAGVAAGVGGAWGGSGGGLVVAALLGKTWMEGVVSAGSLVANFMLAWVMLLSVARAVEAYHKMLRRSRSLLAYVSQTAAAFAVALCTCLRACCVCVLSLDLSSAPPPCSASVFLSFLCIRARTQTHTRLRMRTTIGFCAPCSTCVPPVGQGCRTFQ